MRSITKSNEESDVNHIFQKIKHSIGLELSMMEGKALIETTSPCTWREASHKFHSKQFMGQMKKHIS